MIRKLSILLMLAVALLVSAQNTTRKGLRLKEDISSVRSHNDTIIPTKGDIRLSGFEKSQNSSNETFFVTNNTDKSIKEISLEITYLNTKGELLHKRIVTLRCDIPQSETRMLSIKSWDRHHLWHYKLTQGSHNDRSTPFDVKINIKYVVVDS